jgi:putative intracellular protease/amidase
MATIPQVRPSFRQINSHEANNGIETSVPYTAFKKAGFEVHFATENGKTPQCDEKMLKGLTQKLLVRLSIPHLHALFSLT